MSEQIVTAGGRDRTLQVAGPDGALMVLLLPASPAEAAGYGAVVERLTNSGLRSLLLADHDGLDTAGIIAILNELGADWVHLAGSGAGAALAWQVAARHFDRISSLVVIDHGHPAAADTEGLVEDASCPAVEVATTLILTVNDHRARAYGTGRHTYSDYRVVELPAGKAASAKGSAVQGSAVQGELATALGTEIILRSNPW